jgi:hypothetical protein
MAKNPTIKLGAQTTLIQRTEQTEQDQAPTPSKRGRPQSKDPRVILSLGIKDSERKALEDIAKKEGLFVSRRGREGEPNVHQVAMFFFLHGLRDYTTGKLKLKTKATKSIDLR